MKNILFYIAIILLLSINLFPETTNSMEYIFENPFRVYEVDKYYTGFQDPRAFTSRLLFAKNIGEEKSLTIIAPEANWNFQTVALYVNARVASEFFFYRNNYFSIGMGGAIDIDILGRVNGIFDVYDLSGQFAVFADLWLQHLSGINIKIRFIPMYHQSTHLVDGFQGDNHIKSGSSYELASVATYYYINNFSIYGGIEFSYNTVGNSPQVFRIHTGVDYRYPIYKDYIKFITGINIAGILDKKDRLGLIKEPWHAAINIASGIEFYRLTIALKYGFSKPRGASSYFNYENKIGVEVSVLF